jgi:hypothetical protein
MMRRSVLWLRAGALGLSTACTGVTANHSQSSPPPKSGEAPPPSKSGEAPPPSKSGEAPAGPTVTPNQHHDVSPPLRDIPPTERPPDDLKREIPIHRLPLPGQR